jgi:hypothetical protein
LWQIPGSAVVYVIGTYNDMDSGTRERVKNLFSKGIAVAASVSDAVIMDGGLSSNISSAETTAAVRPLSSVLGVSRCEGMYGIDPTLSNFHHHHVVVRCSDKLVWKARLKMIHSIRGPGKAVPPVLIILAGKEDGCEEMLKVAADKNWGIIVIPGTGGQADELCAVLANVQTGSKAMQHVAKFGNASVLPETCEAKDLRTLCRVHLMLSGLAKMWTGDESDEDDEEED